MRCSWATVDCQDVVFTAELHMYLMFVEALAEGLVWNVRRILATLIVVWVCFCKLIHGFLKLFRLLQYFVWGIVLVYLGGDGFPYVVDIVVTEPHAVYTHCLGGS